MVFRQLAGPKAPFLESYLEPVGAPEVLGRIVANLAKLLAAAGEGRGLISICAAGGQGVTAILER